MKTPIKKISGGIYLVVDPATGIDILLPQIAKAIEGGIEVLQVWNNWKPGQDKNKLIAAICSLAHEKNIPVLINEEWQLLRTTELDGVHFDNIPDDLNMIRQSLGRPVITGLTCGNDLDIIRAAIKEQFDYISFCSMFPSESAGVCEIVSPETVRKARELTDMPIFLAGGISLDNIDTLTDTGMNGVALISAIMKSEDPKERVLSFRKKLNTINSTI